MFGLSEIQYLHDDIVVAQHDLTVCESQVELSNAFLLRGWVEGKRRQERKEGRERGREGEREEKEGRERGREGREGKRREGEEEEREKKEGGRRKGKNSMHF